MADGVFNISKGAWAEKVADDNTKIVVLLLKVAEADGTLEDYDDIAALLAGSNTEADFTNYARKSTTDTDGTVTTNDTDNRKELSLPEITWSSAGGATNNTMVKLITAYNSGAGDANLIPMTHHDYTETTSGSDLVVNTGDYARAS